MDIKIEAPKHENQEQLIKFYSEKLQKKYGSYDFIKSIDVKIVEEADSHKTVAIQTKPEKGVMLYVKHTDANENVAVMGAIKKMNKQIEKYKEVHYHSKRRGGKAL